MQNPDATPNGWPQAAHLEPTAAGRGERGQGYDRNAEAERYKIEERCELTGDDAVVEGDAVRLRQRIENSPKTGIGRHRDHGLVR